jgi:hypothetical protein
MEHFMELSVWNHLEMATNRDNARLRVFGYVS